MNIKTAGMSKEAVDKLLASRTGWQKFKDKARLTEDIIKYNTTVMDFIANPQKLADKNEKIKEKVITAEQKKKARKIADRIN
ncbi:MAG: hypothetical protein II616_06585, partial [Bacteroidales bacterium]|nr:hypothetical protein [Bacteroidales bacterium]